MNLGLKLGQSQVPIQKPVMTAMLQQAIKLMPLTRQELILKISQEIVKNPFLEDIQTEEEGYDIDTEWDNSDADLSSTSIGSDSSEPEIDLTSYVNSNLDMGYYEGDRSELPSLENRLRKETTLTEHLLWQLSLAEVPEHLKSVCIQIIGNLSDNGYFQMDVDNIALGTDITSEDMEQGLKIIQSFDPPGIAAQNIQECLRLQIQTLGNYDPLIDKILEHHLEDLEERFLPKVARSLGVEISEVVEVRRLIRSLNFEPGLLFNKSQPEYVYPDVYALKTGSELDEEYQISLNEDGMPRLRINSTYRELLRKEPEGNGRQYMKDHLQSALWLIKSIEHRRQTLLKVSRSIVRFQRDFLNHGIQSLRPLILRDVALDINMSESTVSRVTTGKYMHTPHGIEELKFFFSGHSELKSLFGENTPSVSVKNQLRRLLDEEDVQQPFTDQQIADLLKGRNVEIARRTVTKYRKELRIPPASRRKRVAL